MIMDIVKDHPQLRFATIQLVERLVRIMPRKLKKLLMMQRKTKKTKRPTTRRPEKRPQKKPKKRLRNQLLQLLHQPLPNNKTGTKTQSSPTHSEMLKTASTHTLTTERLRTSTLLHKTAKVDKKHLPMPVIIKTAIKMPRKQKRKVVQKPLKKNQQQPQLSLQKLQLNQQHSLKSLLIRNQLLTLPSEMPRNACTTIKVAKRQNLNAQNPRIPRNLIK